MNPVRTVAKLPASVVLVLIGVVLVAVGLHVRHSTQAFERHAVRTAGHVVEALPRSGGSGGGTTWASVVEYTPAGATEPLQVTSDVSSSHRQAVGTEVDVLYDRTEPRDARIDGASRTWLPRGLVIGGIVLALLGAWGVLSALALIGAGVALLVGWRRRGNGAAGTGGPDGGGPAAQPYAVGTSAAAVPAAVPSAASDPYARQGATQRFEGHLAAGQSFQQWVSVPGAGPLRLHVTGGAALAMRVLDAQQVEFPVVRSPAAPADVEASVATSAPGWYLLQLVNPTSAELAYAVATDAGTTATAA